MALPLSGTHIALISGVPFSNDFKNTRYFTSEAQQKSYFSGMHKVHLMDRASFQRDTQMLYVRVNEHINNLRDACYLYFNNEYPDGKVFYAFITSMEYVNDKLTKVYFEIDPLQTWLFDFKFKPSFVVREHRPQYYDTGKPVINTIDEGLNYGTDYELLAQETLKVSNYRFLVIVCKETVHGDSQEITPNYNGIPQPLTYYIVPFSLSGTGFYVEGNGFNKVLFAGIIPVLKGLYTDDSTVNEVVSLYVTDYFGVPFKESVNADGATLSFETTNPAYSFKNVKIADVDGSGVYAFYVEHIYEYKPMFLELPHGIYTKFRSTTESKLLMSPYSVLILDDFKGNRFTIKPEYVFDNKLKLCVRGSLGTSNKVSYSVVGYNYDIINSDAESIKANLENGIIDTNSNDVPIMSDNLASYIQGNRNSLQVKMKSAEFNGMMAIAGGMATAVSGVGSLARLNPAGAGQIANGVIQGVTGAGNNLLKIQGIEAKGKDIDNTPPTLGSMGSNTSYEYGNGFYGVSILTKMIRPEYQRKLEDFFNMFGYKYNEVKIPNFNTRKYWNYVQTENCNITGNFDNDDLQKIKTIFDGGITLWHTDDIGNYALKNEVI